MILNLIHLGAMNKKSDIFMSDLNLVLEKGLEPLCLAAYEPESYVSTNFTTRAQ